MAFNPWLLTGPGAMGALSTMGQKNPADAAMSHFDQIPDILKQYYQPYIDAGQRQLPGLESQYGQMTNDPGGKLNQIGQGYHESPGFKFALQQALQGSNQASAAGGMLGSPQSQQQNMGLATNMADQDYNKWMQQALGIYGGGLSGQQGLYDTGFNASGQLGTGIANNKATQGSLAFQGQNNMNQGQGDMFRSLGQIGALAAFM